MTSLQERLSADVKTAMKAGAKEDLEVLRSLLADAKNVAIAEGLDRSGVTDEVVLRVLRKAIKTRQEAAELFVKGQRPELAAREEAQIDVIRRYLPTAASDAEIELVVDTVITEFGAKDRKEMGRVIKEAASRLQGRAEGAQISRIVGSRLPG